MAETLAALRELEIMQELNTLDVESGVCFIAGVGCIALFGVAVLNGVGMIAAINRLREECRAVKDAALESAAMRLQPALMTALAQSPGSAHALPLVRARV